MLQEESARLARFGRPGHRGDRRLSDLDDVTDRLGRDVADRAVTRPRVLLVTDGRAADRLAWLGYARFGVLLLETEERDACRYVDRLPSRRGRLAGVWQAVSPAVAGLGEPRRRRRHDRGSRCPATQCTMQIAGDRRGPTLIFRARNAWAGFPQRPQDDLQVVAGRALPLACAGASSGDRRFTPRPRIGKESRPVPHKPRRTYVASQPIRRSVRPRSSRSVSRA